MDVQRRKQAWMDFMDLRSPINRLLVIECPEGMPRHPMLWWEEADARVEAAYRRYVAQLERLDTLEDFSIPHLRVSTGTEIFAEAFGCRVHYPSDNNPFALPMVESAREAARIRVPRVEDTKLTILFDMARKLRGRAGGDALLSLPDMQTPGDIAALIWEKTDFYPAMIEEPEAVRELMHKIRGFMFAFLDMWFAEFGRETMAHYPDYYMPYGITLSEDEIGAVSPAMFDEFFADDLRMFSERYGQIGIHCCAHSKHQWANLAKTPNLRLINLHLNARLTLESLDAFRNVCAQMPQNTAADPDTLSDPERLHVAHFIHCPTLAEARAAMGRFYGRYPHMAP